MQTCISNIIGMHNFFICIVAIQVSVTRLYQFLTVTYIYPVLQLISKIE